MHNGFLKLLWLDDIQISFITKEDITPGGVVRNLFDFIIKCLNNVFLLCTICTLYKNENFCSWYLNWFCKTFIIKDILYFTFSLWLCSGYSPCAMLCANPVSVASLHSESITVEPVVFYSIPPISWQSHQTQLECQAKQFDFRTALH